MRILAIETSCDETGIAVVEGEKIEERLPAGRQGFTFRVLGAALLSQAALHAEYGGVYPTLAKREHEKNLPIMLVEALKAATEHEPLRVQDFSAKKSLSSPAVAIESPSEIHIPSLSDLHIDAIAVTVGPGLEPALWTGITFAEKLAQEWQLPLIPVNHMEGHLLSSMVKDGEIKNIQFPVLGLLVSGGHTEFVLMRDWFDYEIIGQTLDDAVGEAFDKVARMLGLPYPGGPQISKLAEWHRGTKQVEGGLSTATAGELSKFSAENLSTSGDFVLRRVKLPRPMIGSDNCDVSFSGLKTAALYKLRDLGGIEKLDAEQKAAFAREFEDAVGDIFVSKTRRALRASDANSFVIGGGVAANKYLRERLQKLLHEEFSSVQLFLPEVSITGDNAVMIAEAALVHLLSGRDAAAAEPLRANGSLSISSKK